MSELCSNAMDDGDFDTIMENSCPTTVHKFQWIVKDLTQYPKSYAVSPCFYPLPEKSCNLELGKINEWIEGKTSSPYLMMELHWGESYFIKSNTSLCDSNYKVLFEHSITNEVYHNTSKVYLGGFGDSQDLLQKLRETGTDTLIIRCRMEISHPEKKINKKLL
ncbi:hypothetical protein CDAR_252811 [Caerostris darwini]|uniref:Uncharacterized protein n=1 Tax=Caerostris darwini TaxID=1538125 RepID=A0AAV4Q5Z6_9ARAC|nr:hypothetical protein CDAR_252811 [Caerostris darwini]